MNTPIKKSFDSSPVSLDTIPNGQKLINNMILFYGEVEYHSTPSGIERMVYKMLDYFEPAEKEETQVSDLENRKLDKKSVTVIDEAIKNRSFLYHIPLFIGELILTIFYVIIWPFRIAQCNNDNNKVTDLLENSWNDMNEILSHVEKNIPRDEYSIDFEEIFTQPALIDVSGDKNEQKILIKLVTDERCKNLIDKIKENSKTLKVLVASNNKVSNLGKVESIIVVVSVIFLIISAIMLHIAMITVAATATIISGLIIFSKRKEYIEDPLYAAQKKIRLEEFSLANAELRQLYLEIFGIEVQTLSDENSLSGSYTPLTPVTPKKAEIEI